MREPAGAEVTMPIVNRRARKCEIPRRCPVDRAVGEAIAVLEQGVDKELRFHGAAAAKFNHAQFARKSGGKFRDVLLEDLGFGFG